MCVVVPQPFRVSQCLQLANLKAYKDKQRRAQVAYKDVGPILKMQLIHIPNIPPWPRPWPNLLIFHIPTNSHNHKTPSHLHLPKNFNSPLFSFFRVLPTYKGILNSFLTYLPTFWAVFEYLFFFFVCLLLFKLVILISSHLA